MKNKIKIIIAFVLGAIIFGSIGVYAATQILSKDISYTRKDGTTTSVENVLNDLYDSANMDFVNKIDGSIQNSVYKGDRINGKTTSLNLAKGNYYLFVSVAWSWGNTDVWNQSGIGGVSGRISSSQFKCKELNGYYSIVSPSSLNKGLRTSHKLVTSIYLCSSEQDGTVTYTLMEGTDTYSSESVILQSLKLD